MHSTKRHRTDEISADPRSHETEEHQWVCSVTVGDHETGSVIDALVDMTVEDPLAFIRGETPERGADRLIEAAAVAGVFVTPEARTQLTAQITQELG